jgi:SAM-dependent methyltransferase
VNGPKPVGSSGPGAPEPVLLDAQYLDLTYSVHRAPAGDYPSLLAAHLLEHWYRSPGRLLDFGSGRGDALRAFAGLGFEAVGADVSPRARELAAGFEVVIVDPVTSVLPFPDSSFDCVFSKSVVEHMGSPIDLAREAWRVLRPGGTAVVMTPSWEHQAWGPFYIDHTHVTPFTAPALRDLLLLAGFEEVESTFFHQLPFVWRHTSLRLVPEIVRRLPLPYRPYRATAPWPESLNKLIRFSKEVMLLAAGRKGGA